MDAMKKAEFSVAWLAGLSEIVGDPQLYELLKEIPQQRREVFFLAYLDGKKTKEIADQLDMPVRTVESHLHLTLKFLKKHLSKKDFFFMVSVL